MKTRTSMVIVTILAGALVAPSLARADDEKIELTCKVVAAEAGVAGLLGVDSAGDALKLVAKAGAWALERYADKLEGTYSTKLIADDLRPGGTLPNRECVFKRSVDGSDAIELTFRLVPDEDGVAYRVKATQLVVNQIKAEKGWLPWSNRDEIDVVFTFKFRGPFHGADGWRTIESDPVTLKLEEISKNLGTPIKPADKLTDWLVTPTLDAYSLEVSALETSDLKAWVEKAAKLLEKAGE